MSFVAESKHAKSSKAAQNIDPPYGYHIVYDIDEDCDVLVHTNGD